MATRFVKPTPAFSTRNLTALLFTSVAALASASFLSCSTKDPGAVDLSRLAATGTLSAPQAPVVIGGVVQTAPASAVAAAVDKVVSGTFTTSATVKVWWDTSYLGVETIFNDSGPSQIDSTNLWDDDSVELYIDADNSKGTSYDSFDRQFVITAGKALWEQHNLTTGVLATAVSSGNTLTVRYAVPWSNLGVTAVAGRPLGFDVGVNDDDNGGARDGQVMAFGTANNWSTTAPWGTVVLAGGGGGAGGAGGAPAGGAGGTGGVPAGGAGGLPAGGTGGVPAGGAGGASTCSGSWNTTVGILGGPPVSRRTDVTVTKYATLPFSDPTRIARDPVTGKLFILRENGELYRLDNPGTANPVTLITSPSAIGATTGAPVQSLGMAFSPNGTLYLTTDRQDTATGFAFDSQATLWRGTRSGSSFTYSIVAQTVKYPRSKTYFDHEWSGIAVSPDGNYLYVNAGSRTDHGEIEDAQGHYPNTREIPLTAKVFKIPANATALVLNNDDVALAPYIFTSGTRNSFDPEFAPNGDLLAGDNGPDADYHEELNWLQAGAHYGFPWRIGNEANLMAQKSSYVPGNDWHIFPGQPSWYADAGFPDPKAGTTLLEPILNPGPEADQYRDTDRVVKRASQNGKTFGTFTDHGSPLGLAFDNGSTVCSTFSNKAFIMRFGLSVDSRKQEANGFEQGRDVLWLDLSKATGTWKLNGVRTLVGNLQHPVDNVLISNRMYIVDRANGDHTNWAQGVVWEVTLPNATVNAPSAPVVSGSAIVAPPASATAVPIARAVNGAITNAASFKVWWDASYLGVEAIFNDSGPNVVDSVNLWDDDSIELYVDANGNRGSTYDSFDRQYVIAVGKPLWEQHALTTGVLSSATLSGNTMTVRYAIRWSNLGVTATVGKILGLDVGVNDDDNGGARDGQDVAFGTANNWTDTSTWGVIKLQ